MDLTRVRSVASQSGAQACESWDQSSKQPPLFWFERARATLSEMEPSVVSEETTKSCTNKDHCQSVGGKSSPDRVEPVAFFCPEDSVPDTNSKY